jgi:hypothetical protein
VPYCAETGILYSADDLRMYFESENHYKDIGRTIVSVVETQLLSDVIDLNRQRWIRIYYAPAKEMIEQCISDGIASALDYMVTCVLGWWT